MVKTYTFTSEIDNNLLGKLYKTTKIREKRKIY